MWRCLRCVHTSAACLLLLVYLVQSVRVSSGQSLVGGSNLTSISLSGSVDRYSELAVHDIVLAYRLQEPNVTISQAPALAAAIILSQIAAGTLDFGITTQGLTAAQASANPAITMYPVLATAVVPVYRLDALTATGSELVLTRTALAAIYEGTLTWWNDSRIAQSNPTVVLPQKQIVICYHDEQLGLNAVFSSALAKFDANFTQYATVGLKPFSQLTSNWLSVAGIYAVAAAVTAQDGTIGYAVLAVALQMNNHIAKMQNKAGLTVTANARSVTYAAVELGTQVLSRTTLTADLTDATGSGVWPICAMSYLIIDTQNSPSTCHARAAIVDFFLFYYQSPVVSGLLLNRQYARVPDIVMSSLSVLDNLQNQIMCRGVTAYTAAAVTTRTMSVPTSISFLAGLLTPLYTDTTHPTTWTATTVTDQLSFDQLVNGEIDIAFFDPNNIDAAGYAEARSSGDYLILPTFMYAITWMYNPQITSTVNIAAYTLRLDFGLVTRIFYSCIIYWNDPAILALNPWLYPLIGNTTMVPIQSVHGCGSGFSSAPIASSFSRILFPYLTATQDGVTGACLGTFFTPRANMSGGVTSVLGAVLGCVNQPQLYLQFATSETTIPSLVLGSKGGQGYFIANGDTTFGVPTMPWTRNGVSTDTVADTNGISACAMDTFDADQLTFNTAASQSAACWPWTGQVMAMIRTRYTTTADDTGSCSRGVDAARWLQWLYSTSAIDILTTSVDVQLASSVSPAVRSAYIAALNTVTCDGQTLLITLPTVWTLEEGISAFAQALFAIGFIGCLVASGLVTYHRAHPVIRSASPLFLFMSILGVAMIFASGFLLIVPATAATCSGFQWLLNFGLMLCFAPLFAKTYRIYRIFGRKKLSVVQLSNKKLFLIVLAMLAVEAVLQAVWQALGPIAPLTIQQISTDTNSAGHNIINQYTQCGIPQGAPMHMFAAIVAEKGILFVFGAMMAFTTRKVSSTFNESQGISLSIYNVCFTIGIISPIIIVISAVGDVLTLLLVFALLWIAYFTGGILIVPKLLTIYNHTNGKDEVNASVMASSSSSSGYQFLSLAALSSLPMLQGYQASLRKHLEAVDARVMKMKAGKGSVGSTVQQRHSATKAYTSSSTAISPPAPARRMANEQSILGSERERERDGSLAGGSPAVRPIPNTTSTRVTSPSLQARSTGHALVPGASMTASVSKQAVVERSTNDDEHSANDSAADGPDSLVLGERLLLTRGNTGS